MDDGDTADLYRSLLRERYGRESSAWFTAPVPTWTPTADTPLNIARRRRELLDAAAEHQRETA